MTGFFEHIAQFDDGQRVAGRKAAAAAQKRISDRMGSFLKRARSLPEYEARLDLVSDDIRQIVADVAEEYDADLEHLQEAIDDHLKGDGVTNLNAELEDAPSAVGHKSESKVAGGGDFSWADMERSESEPPDDDDEDKEPDDDEDDKDKKKESAVPPRPLGGDPHVIPCPNCGEPTRAGTGINCPNCGAPTISPEFQNQMDSLLPGPPSFLPSPEQRHSPKGGVEEQGGRFAVKTAEADRDGGGAVKTEDLPTGKGEKVGTEPSPKMDKTQWKPNALYDNGNIDVIDSEQSDSPVPTVRDEDVVDGPEYESQQDEGDSFLDQTDNVVEQQTLPTADETGQSTDRNISGQDSQSDTWHTNDGQTDPVDSSAGSEVLSSFVPDDQVESAIQEYESE